MMSSSGVSALSWVSAPCSASYNAVRPVGSIAWSDSASRRCAGSNRAIAGLAASRNSASAGLSAASRPSASLNGRYGGGQAPKSRQCPTITRQPWDRTRSLNSATRRLLPAPASPPSTTAPPAVWPRPTRSHRVRSSSTRPIRGVARVSGGTPAIMTDATTEFLRSVVRCRVDPVVFEPAGHGSVRLVARRAANRVAPTAVRVPDPLEQARAGELAACATAALYLPATVGELRICEVLKHGNRSPLWLWRPLRFAGEIDIALVR